MKEWKEILKICCQIVSRHSRVVMTGFPIKTIPDWILLVVNFLFLFHEICVQNQWSIKLWDPSWGLRQWQSEFKYIYDGILIRFLILIVNFVWKTDEGGAESIVLLIFPLWRCFNHQRVKGGGVGLEILIQGQLKSHPFPGGILTEAIRMTHSGIFVSTGYCYVLFLWAIAVSDFRFRFGDS